MIARFPGPCKNCGLTIQKGEDCWYESDTRTIAHHACPVASEKPSPEAFRLADELGFVGPDDVVPVASWRTWKVKSDTQPKQGFLL